MSANLIVDIGNTCQLGVSIASTPFLSGGLVAVGSGAVIGASVDMHHSDTYCNLFAMGVSASGQLRLQVQVADSDVSGQFTDPTSGLPAGALPGAFQSGGLLWINSGGVGNGLLGALTSGQAIASGFEVAQAFIRTGRYARVNTVLEGSAQFAGSLLAGFISQLKTTGSGAGFSFSPGSGVVNV